MATEGSKFKVGDRVLVTANEDGEGEGKTAVIIHMCSPLWAHVRFEQPIDGWGEDGQEWGVGVEKLKLVPASPATLTIESGKFYRTRDGRKVGPARAAGRQERFAYRVSGNHYNKDGSHRYGEAHKDLISEWVDEPSAAAAVPASNDNGTAGYTVPMCAFEGESDATLTTKITVDFSDFDAELDRIFGRLRKLRRKARKMGISLHSGELQGAA